MIQQGDYRAVYGCSCMAIVLEVMGPGKYRCRIRQCFWHGSGLVVVETSYSDPDGLAARIERGMPVRNDGLARTRGVVR